MVDLLQTAATANTGGGGGAGGNGGQSVAGGAGGSGVVIIHFTTSSINYRLSCSNTQSAATMYINLTQTVV